MTRLAVLGVLLIAALVLAGCGEEAAPEPTGMPEPLETVDLCGEDGNTRTWIRAHLGPGGAADVTRWLRGLLQLPAKIRTCNPAQAEATVHEPVIRVTVTRLSGQGTALGAPDEIGTPLERLPLGVRDHTLEVYPEDPSRPDAEGVRVTITTGPPR